MKPARLIISALILLTPVAYVALQAKPRPPASVEEEIKDVEQQANAAYEANDLPKYFSFYATDFHSFCQKGGPILPAIEGTGLHTSEKGTAFKRSRFQTCIS